MKNLKELFEAIKSSEKYFSGDALFDNLEEKFPETELDYEIDFEDVDAKEFEEVEENEEEEEEETAEDKEYRNILIKLAKKYIKVMKSQIKVYVEREGEEILKEIGEKYGEGMKEFVKQAGGTAGGRVLIEYLEKE